MTLNPQIFIIHAFEDQASIINQIDKTLKEEGYKTWYSKENVGAKLDEEIENGFATSHASLIIFTENLLNKENSYAKMKEIPTAIYQDKIYKKKLFCFAYGVSVERIHEKFPSIKESDYFIFRSDNIDIGMQRLLKVMKKAFRPKRNYTLILLLIFTIILISFGLFSLLAPTNFAECPICKGKGVAEQVGTCLYCNGEKQIKCLNTKCVNGVIPTGFLGGKLIKCAKCTKGFIICDSCKGIGERRMNLKCYKCDGKGSISHY